jgi:hypothetical protein
MFDKAPHGRDARPGGDKDAVGQRRAQQKQPMRSVHLNSLSHLEIAQQVREEPALHSIDAHVKLVAAGRRCDGIGPGLLLSCGVMRHSRDELARLEIEAVQLFDSEFKMETTRAF